MTFSNSENISSAAGESARLFFDLDRFIDLIIESVLNGDNQSVFDAAACEDYSQTIIEKKTHKGSMKKVAICIGFSKYEAVRRVVRKLGFEEVEEKDNWNLYWTDGFITPDKMSRLKVYQKINHFPGMIEICRKDSLARNVNRLLKLFPEDYEIIPRTWCLPTDIIDFQFYCRKNKCRNFILKPEASCQGKGILITKNIKDLKSTDGMVCQVYVNHPFLMDEFKFDLRIYVLVTSIEPLRIYAYNEGLVRFTTVKYEVPNNSNMNNVFMHLTNYALQKESMNFIHDNEFNGTKRRFSVLNKWFIDNGYDIKKIWQDIDDVIIKTLISIHCTLRHNYRSAFPNHTTVSACYELLGFDIILDDLLQPLLIEVNHSPSFHTDSQLDREVKDSLLFDTFRILNLNTIKKTFFYNEHSQGLQKRLYSKKQKLFSKEEENAYVDILKQKIFELEKADMGNYRLLFPTENSSNYDKFINNSISLFNETFSYRVRLKCAHKLQDNIRQKQLKIDSMKVGLSKPIHSNEPSLTIMRIDFSEIDIKIIESETTKILMSIEILEMISNCVEVWMEIHNVESNQAIDPLFQNFLLCLEKYFPDGDCRKEFKSSNYNENTKLGVSEAIFDYFSIATILICEDPNQNYLSTTTVLVNWNHHGKYLCYM